MNKNNSFAGNKKLISGLGGLIIFLAVSYFVFNFTQLQDVAILSANQDTSTILKPEVVSFLQTIDKKVSFLKDKNIMDTDFVKNLHDYSERIDILYPKGRSNPFAP